MICINQTLHGTAPQFCGSQTDFLHALETLGAIIQSPGGRGPETALQVRFHCAASDWARLFGELRLVGVASTPDSCGIQAWAYQCSDGTVLCFGFQYRSRSDQQYIVIRALHLE